MVHRIGQRLGNYRLTRLLGRGGFAEVYLGEHVHLGTFAAIKILQTRLLGNDIAHFHEEARTIAQLDHPNIVHVLDFDVKENVPFLVMEYAPNGTLRKQHPKGSCVPLERVVFYVGQMARALQHAHDQRFVHRDVKPENMLLGKHGNVLLSDFGMATIARNTISQKPQSVQSMEGTIVYMAPEQIAGQPRIASDQYSLGIVVYEWLCGEPPFTGDFATVATDHCMTPPPSLYEKMPTIPLEVEHVVMTALAKETKNRFPNITAFSSALAKAARLDTAKQRAFPFPGPGALPASLVQPPVPNQLPDEIPPETGRAFPLPPDVLPPETFLPIKTAPTSALFSRRAIIAGTAGLLLASGGISTFALLNKGATQSSLASATTPDHTGTTLAFSGTGTASTSAQTTIYIGSTDRNLYALNAADGSVQWSRQSGDWVTSRPAIANGIVYAGSNDHYLYAVQASNGAVLWRYLTGDKVLSWPIVSNGAVYVGSNDQYIYALATSNGSLLWRYQTGGAVVAPAQIVDGILYIGSNDYYVYALQASTGALLWKSKIGGNVTGQATIADMTVYVGSVDHSLYALRVSDGTQSWQYRTGDAIYSTPEVNNGMLYFGSLDHTIYALRASNHTLVWHYLTANQVASSPTVQDGTVYVGSNDGIIYALKADTGTLLWHYQTGNVISSKPVVAQGIVYVGGTDGLFALHAGTGSLLWRFAAGGGTATTPTIAP